MEKKESNTKNKETANKRQIVSCPLCGMSFDANNQQACKACGKRRNCPMVSCPNCYHEFLPSK